ncbi:hypothetical protein D3C80_727330 [compost metagenome]
MAVCGRLRQRCLAAGLFQAEIHGNRPRLVVVLAGQPAPGLGGAWADTGDQGRFLRQLAQSLVQGLLLLAAVVGRQDHLHQLRFAGLGQVQQLPVGQRLVLGYTDGHSGLWVHAWCHTGDAGVIDAQLFQACLGGRAGP